MLLFWKDPSFILFKTQLALKRLLTLKAFKIDPKHTLVDIFDNLT